MNDVLNVKKKNGPAERVAFLRIGKTASQWLSEELWNHFGDGKYCPHIFAAQYRSLSKEDRENFSCFSGHFGFRAAQTLNAKLITVLRNPIDRIVSIYHYWREVPETDFGPGVAKRLSFAEFLLSDEPVVVSDLHNAQAWQLAWDHEFSERAHLVLADDDNLFDIAVKNLKSFSVVGVTECLTDLALTVEDELGIPIRHQKRAINATQTRPKLSDIPIRIRGLIARRVEVDMAIYDHVLKTYVFPRVAYRARVSDLIMEQATHGKLLIQQ
jgi:hypothetical protein